MKLEPIILERALALLSAKLDIASADYTGLVVCGGSALIALGLRQRTTYDVDVVALIDQNLLLRSPEPLPDNIITAASQVARDFGLNENWLNNEPSNGDGGLFQLGLPSGFADRLVEKKFGPRLSVFYISRFDQIHFKFYAGVDQRDGTHLSDLRALNPNSEELEAAAKWAMTHDVSEGFNLMSKELLNRMGYEHVASKL